MAQMLISGGIGRFLDLPGHSDVGKGCGRTCPFHLAACRVGAAAGAASTGAGAGAGAETAVGGSHGVLDDNMRLVRVVDSCRANAPLKGRTISVDVLNI